MCLPRKSCYTDDGVERRIASRSIFTWGTSGRLYPGISQGSSRGSDGGQKDKSLGTTFKISPILQGLRGPWEIMGADYF